MSEFSMVYVCNMYKQDETYNNNAPFVSGPVPFDSHSRGDVLILESPLPSLSACFNHPHSLPLVS